MTKEKMWCDMDVMPTKIDMVKEAIKYGHKMPSEIIAYLKANYKVTISSSMASNYKTVIGQGGKKKKKAKTQPIKYKVTDLGKRNAKPDVPTATLTESFRKAADVPMVTMYEGHPSLKKDGWAGAEWISEAPAINKTKAKRYEVSMKATHYVPSESILNALKAAKQLIAAVGGVSQAKELVDLMA